MIYFVTARSLARVKIGYSENPTLRFCKMRSDSPVNLTLERVCPGELADEQALHVRFDHARIRGEWFSLSEDIEAHIASLPAFPVPTPKVVEPEGSIAQLIKSRGGIRPVARKLGHSSHTTVQGWLERNTIPAEHRAAVEALPPLADAA